MSCQYEERDKHPNRYVTSQSCRTMATYYKGALYYSFLLNDPYLRHFEIRTSILIFYDCLNCTSIGLNAAIAMGISRYTFVL
jgi:hypothetical protein